MTDTERLEWLEKMFDKKWCGTIGVPSTWHIWSGYRHIVQLMKGETFRDAIDKAMESWPE